MIAPDKFKGSLTALEVGDAVCRGLRRVRTDLDAVVVPVADGGDGTLAAAVAAGYEAVPVSATGPVGDRISTAYARRGRTAVVELADVSGLARLPSGRLRPLIATSRGTGDVIAAALDAGCRRVVLGIGGSACTDGGAGMVQALGARLLDADGKEVGPGGAALTGVARVDLAPLRERLTGVEVVVACDVDNPLTGPHGAAHVYGPQKGAGPEEVRLLDRALGHWADTIADAAGEDLRAESGAGAAGGVGFAALALLGAGMRPGIELVLDLTGFHDHVRGACLVVTGEGSLDEQSLRGKAPVGVASAARTHGVPVLAVCGRSTLSAEQLRSAGIDAVYALADVEPDPARSMAAAAELLERCAARLAADHLGGERLHR